MKNFQSGMSSMMVLLIASLLILIAWEIGQFTKIFIESGSILPPNATGALDLSNCYGSKTTFDCFDQDEGTDFVDSEDPSEQVIVGWQDDGKP